MNIIEFKKSNLFEKYDRWIDDRIMEAYVPDFYDFEGKVDPDAHFDEKGFKKAKDDILDVSIKIYDEIGHRRIYSNYPIGSNNGRAVYHASIVIDILDKHKSKNFEVLGTIYYMFIYDYPNYKPIISNKCITMWAYTDLFTRISVEMNCIRDWLDLYSSLKGITSVLTLPECMRDEKTLIYLNRLKDNGFLNDNYKFTSRAKSGAWRHLIAKNLNGKGCCSYSILEEHFGISNLRDSRTLDTFMNRRNYASENAQQIYNTIENCFRHT